MFQATRNYRITFSIFAMVAATVIAPSVLRAQQVEPYKDPRVDAAKILARTMNNPEFRTRGFRGGAWLGNGEYYLAIENSTATPGGTDIVRYATATGARDIFIAAAKMIPPAQKLHSQSRAINFLPTENAS